MELKIRNKSFLSAMTLVEILVAMAIIVVLFLALVPQFKSIDNSWASKRSNAEVIQNARALIDHITFNLMKAKNITVVSSPDETGGYIEFLDCNDATFRYEISDNNYVMFGPADNLAVLAGPVSRLQFTCYDAYDLETPITDVNAVRCVKVLAKFTNTGLLTKDRSFTGRAYLRTNTYVSQTVFETSRCEFDIGTGKTPDIEKIDNSHFLCAYTGNGDDGWAVVLTVNLAARTITNGLPHEFGTQGGKTPALAKIDNTHYLCAYTGGGGNGWAVVLTVNPLNWTITHETPCEFDADNGFEPALSKIDDSHYLCAYKVMAASSVGTAVVLTVNTLNWTITAKTPFVYEPAGCVTPALAQIDPLHHLCAYKKGSEGAAVILVVNPATWEISKGPIFTFSADGGAWPCLARLNLIDYLCAYTINANTGWSRLLTVNLATRTVGTKGAAFEYGPGQGKYPSLAPVDSASCMCVWDGVGDKGTGTVLAVDTLTGAITKKMANFSFDKRAMESALCNVEGLVFICVYHGLDEDGWAVLLNADPPIKP